MHHHSRNGQDLKHRPIILDRKEAVMTRHTRRPADNLRLMVMAAAMNPNDGAQDSEDDDRLIIDT